MLWIPREVAVCSLRCCGACDFRLACSNIYFLVVSTDRLVRYAYARLVLAERRCQSGASRLVTDELFACNQSGLLP